MVAPAHFIAQEIKTLTFIVFQINLFCEKNKTYLTNNICKITASRCKASCPAGDWVTLPLLVAPLLLTFLVGNSSIFLMYIIMEDTSCFHYRQFIGHRWLIHFSTVCSFITFLLSTSQMACMMDDVVCQPGSCNVQHRSENDWPVAVTKPTNFTGSIFLFYSECIKDSMVPHKIYGNFNR